MWDVFGHVKNIREALSCPYLTVRDPSWACPIHFHATLFCSMKNVQPRTGPVQTAAEPMRPCPTCRKPWSANAFYDGCSECKECKRNRSKQNRAMQARKVAAFERFVDVLFVFADRTTNPVKAEETRS